MTSRPSSLYPLWSRIIATVRPLPLFQSVHPTQTDMLPRFQLVRSCHNPDPAMYRFRDISYLIGVRGSPHAAVKPFTMPATVLGPGVSYQIPPSPHSAFRPVSCTPGSGGREPCSTSGA